MIRWTACLGVLLLLLIVAGDAGAQDRGAGPSQPLVSPRPEAAPAQSELDPPDLGGEILSAEGQTADPAADPTAAGALPPALDERLVALEARMGSLEAAVAERRPGPTTPSATLIIASVIALFAAAAAGVLWWRRSQEVRASSRGGAPARRRSPSRPSSDEGPFAPGGVATLEAGVNRALSKSAFLDDMGIPQASDQEFQDRLREVARRHELDPRDDRFGQRVTDMMAALLMGVRTLNDRQEALERSLAQATLGSDPEGAVRELQARVRRLEAEIAGLRGESGAAAASSNPVADPPSESRSPGRVSRTTRDPAAPPTDLRAALLADPTEPAVGSMPELREPVAQASAGQGPSWLRAVVAAASDLDQAVGVRPGSTPIEEALRSGADRLLRKAETARDVTPLKADEQGQMLAAALDRLQLQSAQSRALTPMHRVACEGFLRAFPGYGLIWPEAGSPLNQEEQFAVESQGAHGQQIASVVRPGLHRGGKVLMRALVRLAV